ncbi:MAG: ABC transporter ATP-binding protein [Gemmatimonadetes bacterium]|nr:ABC transporter ATP-binding protein [Gemmatimonadota bacterium]
MSYLVLDGLTRRFGAETGVFGLGLGVEQGGILALLGPSGSGKTTTLRMLGGFERPDAGRILVGTEDVTALRPERRHFGMVFQHYALFPHLDVGENVAFGLESRGVGGSEAARRVREALALVDLAGFERRPVAALSGGQQQRVALARALAPEPRVLLLDEPLSNLDPALRERTRRELRALIRRVGITTVIVTHEQEDAFDLADRVAVLAQGKLEQLGTPEELYRHPATPFVGRFIGRSSWIGGTVLPDAADGVGAVVVEGARWRVRLEAGRPLVPGPCALLLRPEGVAFTTDAARGVPATVTDRRYAGASTFYLAQTAGGVLLEIAAPGAAAVVGQAVRVAPVVEPAGPGDGVHLFPPGPA